MLAAIMALSMFCSCEEEKTPEENAYELLLDKRGPARIEKIYSIVMRLDIPYPFRIMSFGLTTATIPISASRKSIIRFVPATVWTIIGPISLPLPKFMNFAQSRGLCVRTILTAVPNRWPED